MSYLDLWPNSTNSRIERILEPSPAGTHFLRHEVTASKLSIITAVNNRQDTVAQAISSVAAQSYSDVEHLIVDASWAFATSMASGWVANILLTSGHDIF